MAAAIQPAPASAASRQESRSDSSRSDALRSEVRELMRQRPDLTFPVLAAHTTYSTSAWRVWIAGHTPGSREFLDAVARVLGAWRAGEIAAGAASASEAVELAETHERPRRLRRRGEQTVYITDAIRRVDRVCDYCAEHATIGVITAIFGGGKSFAVDHWRRNHPDVDVLHIELDDFRTSNRVEFIRVLARALGLRAGGGAAAMFDAVVAELREHPQLLIIDQAEAVSPRVFQLIRQIWDRTHEDGAGVVILAAPVLRTRMLASRGQELGAITSRVGIWAPLAGVLREECASILKAEGIGKVDDDAFDLLARAVDGSMRRLMGVIGLLKSDGFAGDGKRVSEKTVCQVATHLWGLAIGGGK